jgi:hypothetical protein
MDREGRAAIEKLDGSRIGLGVEKEPPFFSRYLITDRAPKRASTVASLTVKTKGPVTFCSSAYCVQNDPVGRITSRRRLKCATIISILCEINVQEVKMLKQGK